MIFLSFYFKTRRLLAVQIIVYIRQYFPNLREHDFREKQMLGDYSFRRLGKQSYFYCRLDIVRVNEKYSIEESYVKHSLKRCNTPTFKRVIHRQFL